MECSENVIFSLLFFCLAHISPFLSLQGWYLLFLLMPVFLPRRKLFKWYLHEALKQKSHSPNLDEAEFAEHCLKRLAKAEKHESRENKPSWFEVCTNAH